jgi:hypothetical protein
MADFWSSLTKESMAATLSLVNNLRMAGAEGIGFDRHEEDKSQKSSPGNIEFMKDLVPKVERILQ